MKKIFKVQKKKLFHQIIGAVLLDINSSKATYSGLNNVGPTISVHQVGFQMDKGYMVIENPFTLTIAGKSFDSSDLEIFNILRKLIGSRIDQAWFEKEEINIIFNNAHLNVSLKAKDFVSPEAGTYTSKDNSTFIVFTAEN